MVQPPPCLTAVSEVDVRGIRKTLCRTPSFVVHPSRDTHWTVRSHIVLASEMQEGVNMTGLSGTTPSTHLNHWGMADAVRGDRSFLGAAA